MPYADQVSHSTKTALDVNLKTTIAGEDVTNQVLRIEDRSTYAHISTATTTTVKSGAGHLRRITINTTAAGAITVYDNTAASGTVIAVIQASISPQHLDYNVLFTTGLTIVTAAASDITVAYR